jgi:gamma-tubulin complex component 2
MILNHSRDLEVKDMNVLLLEKAAQPFFKMIQQWIYLGKIIDPYDEFMVQENKQYKKEELRDDFNDSYWNQRYVLVQDRVPTFLEKYQDKILLCGKCLNVVRECDIKIKVSGEPVVFSVEDRLFSPILDAAYLLANELLLNLLIKERDLKGHLKSLKRYFLVEFGDFMSHFMDIADEELKKASKSISTTKLQSLLELVLRSGGHQNDAFKDNIKCEIGVDTLLEQLLTIIGISSNTGLTNDSRSMEDIVMDTPKKDGSKAILSGYDAFSLEYEVEFPLSLVISCKSLTKYQMLFRHIFKCHYIEKMLCNSWSKNHMVKKFIDKTSHKTEYYMLFRRADALRQRMVNFIQNVQYYSAFEVIEPNWRSFESKLSSECSSMDKVLQYHSDFLDNCLKECMLTNPKLLKVIVRF